MSASRPITARIDVFGVSGALILTLAGYLLGIEPVFHSRSAAQRSLSTLGEKSQALKIAEANLHVSQMKRAELAKAVEALPFRLEPPTALNDRMTRLTLLAEESRLSVAASEPAAAQPSSRFTATPIRLSGSCTYPALIGFLRAMRDQFPDTRIHELKLVSPLTDTPAEASFSLICTWYAAPDASAAAPDAPSN